MLIAVPAGSLWIGTTLIVVSAALTFAVVSLLVRFSFASLIFVPICECRRTDHACCCNRNGDAALEIMIQTLKVDDKPYLSQQVCPVSVRNHLLLAYRLQLSAPMLLPHENETAYEERVRQAAGETPAIFLKLRLNAASDS